MNITDSKASYRSDNDIESIVVQLRFGSDYEEGFFDILKFYEYQLPKLMKNMKKEFVFRIVNEDDTDIDMCGTEAMTIVQQDSITVCVPEEIYERARHGNGRCRFTLAHELGHVILHSSDRVVLARYKDSAYEIKPYDQAYNAETQANKFAAELLAPLNQVRGLSVKEIMDKYGVSRTVAEIQHHKATRLHK